MGKTNEIENRDSTNTVLSCHVNDAIISDLWRLDSLGICDPSEKKTREELEQSAKEHFFRTVTRNQEGRYQVRLPWVEGHPPLTNCKDISEKRLVNCIKSLKKLGKIEEYETVFRDWLDQGIIEEVGSSEPEHYLPHRPVFKENSTTKVRPVFDGSARDKNSPSINDCLEKGPNLVELIPSVLNRFRIGKYGVIADIEKAFLQIELHEHDRPYLKFLWWQDGQKEQLRIFQHRRVVFGITSSPFLLEATLEFHLNNAPPDYKETAQKLLKSFYVDNCVHSVDNEEELMKFIHESQEILSPARFNLRGWEYTPFEENESDLTETKTVPVLGLKWEIENDTLSVDLRDLDPIAEDQPVTKRIILSTVHKIFDPIGFTCPATLMPKLLLQECWKLKLSWDTDLPSWMTKKFVKWKEQLKFLNDVSIPRCLDKNEGYRNITLHVFCDASEKAYAACIFLRSEGDDSTDCQLIQARARVAPLKSISISRLELLACNIGARLCQSVKESLGMEEVATRYWSDSSNALYWIKKNENWATFVFNRVKEIRHLSDPDDWNHISGQLNPADLPSRGCSFQNLAKSNWWLGPPWLKNPPEYWPKSNIFPDEEIVNAEKRKTVVSVTNTEKEDKIYDIFSSYPKLLMVVSWIYRFIDNCRVKKNFRKLGSITVEERNRAEISLIKIAQRESFTGPQDKRLQKLQILEDENGLFRIKTRLSLKDDFKNFKFPIVLPSEHSIVEKLVRWKHCSLGHAGVQIVMTNLREEFWILKYRKTVRKVVKNCVICKRFDARPIETPTAPLPVDRLRAASVFEIIGVDFAGPLYLKGNQKSWIVIYTCAVFRAIHLELTTSLTTESFLQSFRRYVARRGRPSVVYSDNGTNLVGANNLIKRINWETVAKYSTVNKIDWKFIPPSAPWWGGFWERLIGMVKRIIRKVLGQTSLNFEELNTVLCDCESVINGRPLTYVSDDTSDLEPLTPSMFLQEVREIGIPDLDLLDNKSLNKRFAYRQRLRQDLRKRFRSEYLGQLRQYERKIRSSPSIKIGDIVLISSDNMKRMDWPLGKVIEVFTSPDGNIRLVKLKTRSGEILRPTLRLYPLEVGEHQKELFQKCEPPVKTFTCDDSSAAERDSLDKAEPNETTSRYGRRLKRVKRLVL
ncbi:hypothetical protein AVEN_65314-1 [Araneus ventricosus]|uniref:Integrase catalytic domain-containing protein n=1 Tax=Araneus ventricosus TaxID=182803 RepID=A0A4Y2AG38_ARAVE|nr:hypothetical protein AVEN_65314-1 [Araneus ventricosus]